MVVSSLTFEFLCRSCACCEAVRIAGAPVLPWYPTSTVDFKYNSCTLKQIQNVSQYVECIYMCNTPFKFLTLIHISPLIYNLKIK